ncbi:DinB family protein [Deinococcus sp.]|uniref:DinB family protein n=1 Tax=Deinococcus sp. TaxID=47478 RepID=UPI0025EB704D|nr:DinB family protein [Deinococcus sp.]
MTTLTELSALFGRDLQKLMDELRAYPDEASIWWLPEASAGSDIKNSAGTLALHLVGNLRHLIGAELGGLPYARDWAAEFSLRNVPRAELLAALDETAKIVRTTLTGLDEASLEQPFPLNLAALGFPPGMTTSYLLLHLYGHLNWHLGQINYHRRLRPA